MARFNLAIGKAAGKILYSKIKSEVPMYVGAKQFLQELHDDGYILVLNTSAYNRNSLPLLECAGITTLFDFLATAEISKSKVDKFINGKVEPCHWYLC